MRIHDLQPTTRYRLAAGACAAAAAGCLILLATAQPSGAGRIPPVAAVAKASLGEKTVELDPARVEGAGTCQECHEQEHAAWMKSSHHGSLQAKLDPSSANVKKYCNALGVPLANLRKDSLCVTCHATPGTGAGGGTVAVSGVSCESCHGAAGGQNGWLKPHDIPAAAPANQRKQLVAQCEKAGMIRSDHVYKLAKNCLECHLVGNEKLVLAGHPVGSTGFEVGSWSAGEVRHNFGTKAEAGAAAKNAEAPRLWTARTGRTAADRKRMKFVLGVLADLESSFRHRAAATNAGYMAQLGGRIGGLNGKVAQIAGATQAPELAPLQGVVAGALGRLFVPMADDQKYYSDLAEKVAEAAEQFSEAHDGSKLGSLDPFLKATPAKGAVHRP